MFERIAVVLVPDLLSDSRSGGSRQQDFFPCGQDFLIRKFFLSVGNFSYRWEIFPIGGKFFPSVGIGGTFFLSVGIGGTFFLSVGHFSYPWDIFPIRGTFFLSVGHFSYPPAGHFSYRWDIFPDCGEDFRGGWVQNSTGQQEGRTTGCAPLVGYPRFAPGGGPKRRGTGFEQNTDINS